MALICTNCNADNPKTNRFCDSCGAKLPKVEEAVAAKKAEPAKAAPKKAARADSDYEPTPSLTSPSAVNVAGLDKNLLWLFIIVGFGAFLRLWELGLKPLHHDESIHAWYAYKLFKGDPYKYDPAYHGPFRYHMNALMYFIFGDSDFTTRIFPAITGIFLIAFIWQWRSLIGVKGALFTSSMIAVSPTFTYVSRFIRDDIFMATGSMGMVWGLFKWFETRDNKFLYWMIAGLALAFTSHEGTWIFMGIFGTFLLVRALWENFGNNVEEENELSGLGRFLAPVDNVPASGPLLAGILAFLTTVAGAGICKQMFDGGFIFAGSLTAIMALVAVYFVFSQANGSKNTWNYIAIAFLPLTLIAGALGFIRLRESRKVWIAMLCIFFIPFTLLYSTFFTNMDGWFMGAFDSIAYWLGEQKTGRADQPWQFYIYMLGLYELAIVLFAIVGGFRVFFGSGKPNYFWMKLVAFLPFVIAIFTLTQNPKEPRLVLFMAGMGVLGSGLAAFSTFAPEKGNHFKVFLLYWAMLAYVMFTIAGERMPWLTLHPLTPLTLLAGMYLGEFFDRDKPLLGEHWLASSVLWLPISFFALMAPRQLIQALVHAPKELSSWLAAYKTGGRHGSFMPSGMTNNAWQSGFLTMMPWVLFVILVAATPFIIERWPKIKNWTRGTFFGLFILTLATLSHGTNNLIFHGDGADPREQHVYVQSSVELVELAGKLERMSRSLTGGPYLKIACEDLCSWPMSWYLRDLKNSQIGFGPPMTLDKVKDFPVAITGFDNLGVPNHDQLVADSFKAEYNAYPVRFRRWWAPDKGAFFNGSMKDKAEKAWNLFMYREPWMPGGPIQNPQFKDYIYPKGDSINSPYGSFDACVWVRKDVDRYFQ